MAAARTISPSPVFGLPAILCRLCPQYGHKIIFKRKCYYGPQCVVPSLIGHASLLVLNHKLKTRAGIAGINPVTADASKQVGYVGSVLRLRSGQPTSSIQRAPAPDSHNLPVLIHRMKTAETAATLSPTLCQNAQNFPQVLSHSVPPRRPANLFKRLLAWAWSKSAFNDPTREMTSSGWRKKA